MCVFPIRAPRRIIPTSPFHRMRVLADVARQTGIADDAAGYHWIGFVRWSARHEGGIEESSGQGAVVWWDHLEMRWENIIIISGTIDS